MKKLTALLLTVLFVFTLCACGSGSSFMNQLNDLSNTVPNINDGGQSTTAKLTVGTANSVPGYADFTLFKIYSSKKVTAAMGGGIYYENDETGSTYVDVVLDWTNTSTETITNRDLVSAYAVNASGTEYKSCLYVVETDNYTSVSQFENVAPLSKVRLHCGISVPETETALTVVLDVKGQKYTVDYSMGSVQSNAASLSVGQAVEAADYATMVFNGIEYTDDLMPSNTSGFYTHYPIDDPANNTFLIVKFDITNYQSTDRDCDTFVGVKATYMDKYTYTGSVVVEDEDGEGFSGYEDIAPLSTRHFYYMITVPKSVSAESVVLTVSFNGQEYTYSA